MLIYRRVIENKKEIGSKISAEYLTENKWSVDMSSGKNSLIYLMNTG